MDITADSKSREVLKGVYALVLRLDAEADICVGRLGVQRFAPGYYVYIGSAMNGLRQRIARHLKRGKKLRWHIDYLREHADVTEVWYALSEERLECRLCDTVAAMPGAKLTVEGFGSSDCRCRSHLVYFRRRPGFHVFRRSAPGAEVRRLPVSGADAGHAAL